MKVKTLLNTTNEDLSVTMMNGAEISLPPKATLRDADIVRTDSLQGRAEIREDLTEVNGTTGKTRLLG